MELYKKFKEQVLSKNYTTSDQFLATLNSEITNLTSTIEYEASTKTHLIPYYNSLLSSLKQLKKELHDDSEERYVEYYDLSEKQICIDPFTDDKLYFYEDPDGDEKLKEYLKKEHHITFENRKGFNKFYTSIRYYIKCQILGDNLEAIEDFINEKIVEGNRHYIKPIKTSMTVDQMAMLMNLIYNEFCAAQTDKAAFQRVIATSFISKNGSAPVSINSLKNKMKPNELLSDTSRKELKEILQKWLENPVLKSS